MTRTYDHDGETREITAPEISDEELAERVATFGWEIDIAARDRILCLVKEKAELASLLSDAQAESDKWKQVRDFKQIELEELQESWNALSEQRAELVRVLTTVRNELAGISADLSSLTRVMLDGKDGYSLALSLEDKVDALLTAVNKGTE